MQKMKSLSKSVVRFGKRLAIKKVIEYKSGSTVNVKNQTDHRLVARYAGMNLKGQKLLRSGRKLKGFGVFIFADEQGKKIMDNLSYVECLELGNKATVFKWVPATKITTRYFASKVDCNNHKCTRTCTRPGCLCVDGVCK